MKASQGHLTLWLFMFNLYISHFHILFLIIKDAICIPEKSVEGARHFLLDFELVGCWTTEVSN